VPLRIRKPLGIRAHGAARRTRELARTALGRAPLLAARDLVYDDSFYENVDADSAVLYRRLVDALCDLRAPASVVDVGCGTGLMLARFAEHGALVTGVEGSRAAIRRSRVADRIVRANLERGVPDLGRFDLCLCIEVAEHLSARSGARLVAGLTRLSDVVVFTAAPPGQRGTSHINSRPKQYWQAQFATRGFVRSALEGELLDAIAEVPEPGYIHANLMVFERPGARVSAVATAALHPYARAP
jgi:2-polyprenyl-3-methyl-5-hydroxy-6-metoxy-1,4-benzoquinol methylase